MENILQLLLRPAMKEGTSDVIIAADTAPRYKVHGRHESYDLSALSNEQVMTFVKNMLTDQQVKRLEAEKELDFAYQIGTHRFRGNAFFQQGNWACILRTIPTVVKSAQELDLLPEVVNLAETPRGRIW